MTLSLQPGMVKDWDVASRHPAPVLLLQMAQAALEAVHPRRLVGNVLLPAPAGQLCLCTGSVITQIPYRKLFVVAIGKAAVAMVAAARERIVGPFTGLGVGPCGVVTDLAGWEWWQADHPLPTWRSMHAATAVMRTLMGAGRGDVVLVLLSGGASALVVMPPKHTSLPDIRRLTLELLTRGASIYELNVARRALDLFKAGGMAWWASPAQVVGLILSDVPGNPLWAIGSGPTWPGPPSGHHDAADRAMNTRDRRAARFPFPPPLNIIIGSNETALQAAARVACSWGPVEVRYQALHGEARECGAILAREACQRASHKERVCILVGGETTVTVRGSGRGGRNTELALAFALEAGATQDVWCLTLATDGKDGACPAAGALVGPWTLAAARRLGIALERGLEANDSYTTLAEVGAILATGPTMTNVGDIAAVLVGPPPGT